MTKTYKKILLEGDASDYPWTGQWQASLDYTPLNLAFNLGSSYICIAPNGVSTLVVEPGVTTDWEDYWDIYVQKGDKGETGDASTVPGPAGADGARWYSGTGAPSNSAHEVGDWYENDANGDIYEKTGASAWTLRDNLTGPQGEAGAGSGDMLRSTYDPNNDGVFADAVLSAAAQAAITASHAKQHAIDTAADHTSTATPGKMLKAAATTGLPAEATNTDAEVADAVTKKHAANGDTGVAAKAITLAMMADLTGPVLLGKDSGTGAPLALTAAQIRTIMDAAYVVSEQTIAGAAVTDVSFLNLNINTDKVYVLDIVEYNPSTDNLLYLYANTNGGGNTIDTTATHYYSENIYALGASTHGGSNSNYPEVLDCPASVCSIAHVVIYRDILGYMRFTSVWSRSTTTGLLVCTTGGVLSANTITNITALQVHANVASSIGIGSYFILRRFR